MNEVVVLTPERILEVTEDVLRRYGLAKATVVDVAREAYRLLGAQPVSLSGMVGALLFAGALSWSAAAFTLRNSD